jgi:hypothetical protein
MQRALTPPPSSRRIRVVLSTTALLSFVSVSKATALVLAELGVGVFFVAGLGRSYVGDWAPWFVAVACVLAAIVRAIDIESWAFLVPGGLIARTERAFGQKVSSLATAVMLTERLLLVSLACVLCGQYAVSFASEWITRWSVTAQLTIQELVTTGAIVLIGALWFRSRIRFRLPSQAITRGIWIGVASLLGILVVAGVTSLRHNTVPLSALLQPPWSDSAPLQNKLLGVLVGLAVVLPVLGGGGALGRAARDFAPPRIQSVRRTAFYVVLFVSLLAILSSLFFILIVPRSESSAWVATPLAALAQYAAVPSWIRGLLTVLVVGATLLVLIPAAQASLEDVEQLLRRLSVDGMLPGNLANASNIAAVGTVFITLVSGAQVVWLGRAYSIAIAAALLFRITANARLRKMVPEPRPFHVPGPIHCCAGRGPCGKPPGSGDRYRRGRSLRAFHFRRHIARSGRCPARQCPGCGTPSRLAVARDHRNASCG